MYADFDSNINYYSASSWLFTNANNIDIYYADSTSQITSQISSLLWMLEHRKHPVPPRPKPLVKFTYRSPRLPMRRTAGRGMFIRRVPPRNMRNKS